MTLRSFLYTSRLYLFPILIVMLPFPAVAEGTRSWEQSKFEDLVKGTPNGVAIRSTGGLELAPSFKLLYTTPSTYIWDIAADDAGNIYAAAGSPARVYRITPAGSSSIIFEPQELQVQALKVGPGGAIYAATAPDGKVYKIEHKAAEKPEARKADPDTAPKDGAKPMLDPSWSSSVYFAPGTKYIWDLIFDKAGNLYVATGDHGEIYKVTSKGEHSLFFKSDETHIRVLALDAQGNLIAGTDGSGLVYRISPAGEGFVLYSAPKKEITALALDREGNIYAAGVGEKRNSGTTSAAGTTTSMLITMGPAPAASQATAPGGPVSSTPGPIQIGSFPAPGGSATGGSDVYRIATDGSPSRVWNSHDDIVYTLAFDAHNQLVAGTGNRGHVFALDGDDEYSDLLKAPVSQITSFARAPNGGLYAASSNLGKVFVLGPNLESEGSYESDVFDARIFSRWGRAEFRGAGNVELLARSGNVDNPDRNWSLWKPIDLKNGAEMGVPAARYAQWKAVLHAGSTKPSVDTVTLNYLPKNVAPEIEDVSVQIGVRYQPLSKSSGLTLGTDVSGSSGTHFDSPIPSTHDRDAIGVKWNAHDENDDQLVYSVYYRGDGESRWLLLKDDLTDKAYSFDASLLPDGGYTIKVVASDAPSHSPREALTSSRESRRFEVDTTAPRIENLTASVENGQIHVHFRAEDGFSTIKRAEFSVDAADWKYVDPTDQLSDSKTEDYDFRIPLEAEKDGSSEHVVVVRVYDKYDNMGAAKTILRAK
ncbi:MAG TPA: hypothetical protein VHW45_13245 [Candidatus Sulfotelmatobacter sp.]|jgi:hypothetical protein|nr:hypothetical protein [Candidatus Sulfotelmatobacter sp.]